MTINFAEPGQIRSFFSEAKSSKQKILIRGKYDITGTLKKEDYQHSDLRPGDFIVITGNFFDFDSNKEGLITGFKIKDALINSRLPLENVYATVRKLSDTEKLFW